MGILQALRVMAVALSPLAPHIYQANTLMIEIAGAVEHEKTPIFASKEQDAAILLVTAWEESRFNMHAVGDSGRALCAFQLQNAPKAVLKSPWLCVHLAYQRLRASAAACPEAPLSPYVGAGCGTETGKRINHHRLVEAVMLLEALKP